MQEEESDRGLSGVLDHRRRTPEHLPLPRVLLRFFKERH
ncbi:hypothetical protein BIM11_6137 [Burkholderia pseudomallei]|nr:hypothetical protein BIM11_6137 [Burkholderia pseudomallei]